MEIKFQGGFAATDCLLLAGMGSGEWSELEHFYPSDVNSLQVRTSAKSREGKSGLGGMVGEGDRCQSARDKTAN